MLFVQQHEEYFLWLSSVIIVGMAKPFVDLVSTVVLSYIFIYIYILLLLISFYHDHHQHNRPGVLAQSTEEGYESLAPSAREVDDKYEMIEGRAVVLPRTSDHIYENY